MQIASPRRIESTRPSVCLGSRAGFTLLELMIVIVIIAILLGLLLPAIGSVRIRARITEVRAEISKLEDAIAQFKVTYGTEPPGSITLYAAPAAWEASAASRRSKGLIKQIWPKFHFDDCGGASNGANFPSITGMPTQIDLNGAECLVFFLGGMIDGTSGAFVGFAKDPEHPFASASGAGAITNREGPYFEFKGALNTSTGAYTGRLTDIDGDLVPEYRDPWPGQQRPYAYFNGTSSYRWEAVAPANNPSLSVTPPSTWRNLDCLNIQATSIATPGRLEMPHCYYQSFAPASAAMSRAYKPKGVQIISPGADYEYGVGRLFDPETKSVAHLYDRDNITNFHSGRLGE